MANSIREVYPELYEELVEGRKVTFRFDYEPFTIDDANLIKTCRDCKRQLIPEFNNILDGRGSEGEYIHFYCETCDLILFAK